MTLTLLLDLDDTLLNTNLDAFVPAYFQALARELSSKIEPKKMLHALMAGTRAMSSSVDFSRTLEQVFGEVFYPQIDIAQHELSALIENFYDNVFPSLSTLTSPKLGAREFVDWAFSRGYRIAIATDPLLPRKATYHRLRWAGFAPDEFELVSTFDHFHFSKSHPSYYAEVLGRLGWPEGPVLMVGNDLERDIQPAHALGLAAFHFTEKGSDSHSRHHGDLSDLQKWLEEMDGNSLLLHEFQSVERVSYLLNATPAVLNGMAHQLSSLDWEKSPGAEEWSFTELICHMRDTDREIHRMQIDLFKSAGEPFIPRPDTSIWASQRNYKHENGVAALRQFNEARLEIMQLLQAIPPSNWLRKARHAIFGPTDFQEVVGFIANHDRMHIQQAWSILKAG